MKILILVTVLTLTNAEFNFLESNAKFAEKLLKAGTALSENFIIGATASQAVLALLLLGKSGNSSEYLAELACLDSNSEEVTARFADQVYIYCDRSADSKLHATTLVVYDDMLKIKDEFLNSAGNVFVSEVERYDFSSQRTIAHLINEWFSKQSGLQPFNVTDIKTDTKLILNNAAIFQNAFAKPFLRKDMPFYQIFHLNSTDSVIVPFMRQVGYYKYIEYKEENIATVTIPFKSELLTLTIYLPQNTTSTKQIEQNLADIINVRSNNFTGVYSDMFISMPKFTFTSKVKLENLAEVLGYADVFTETSHGGIVDQPLPIRSIIHTNVFSITEEGINVSPKNAPKSRRSLSPTKIFSVNRPFIFTVSHIVSGVIYVGKVSNPEETSIDL